MSNDTSDSVTVTTPNVSTTASRKAQKVTHIGIFAAGVFLLVSDQLDRFTGKRATVTVEDTDATKPDVKKS